MDVVESWRRLDGARGSLDKSVMYAESRLATAFPVAIVNRLDFVGVE